jgi:hypothetical protein
MSDPLPSSQVHVTGVATPTTSSGIPGHESATTATTSSTPPTMTPFQDRLKRGRIGPFAPRTGYSFIQLWKYAPLVHMSAT